MPTLPLYSHASHPNAWHQVASPGGYEHWHFDAHDPENDRQIVARLHYGNLFDPQYVAQYRRYLDRPTKVTPPLPREFIAAHLTVFHRGRIEQSFDTRHAAERFSASTEGPVEVGAGPNSFHVEAGGEFVLAMLGPDTGLRRSPSAKLRFRPRIVTATAGERELFDESSPGEHRWIIASPLCEVEGQLYIERGGDTSPSIDFRGTGYHDHHYGTSPIGHGVKRWLRGRALLTELNRCVAFQFASPRDARAQDEVHFVEIDGASSSEIEIDDVAIDWPRRRVFTRSGYPSEVRFDDRLKLSHPRAIGSSGCYTTLLFDAEYEGRHLGDPAMCEVVYPGRI